MSNVKRNKYRKWLTSLAAISLLVLSGCDGDTGPAGASGATGPVGSTGPGGPTVATDITDTLTAQITDAVIAADGSLTVNFTMEDDGYGFVGLQSGRIRFTVAHLIPGDDNTGESTKWQSYVNRTEAAPTDPANGPGTVDTIQATSERDGTLVDNGDGSYSYTFSVNLMNATDPIAVTYDATYTHRVAFQISGGGFPTLNRTYDWQPSTGVTTGITSREMVVEGSCNECHGELALHGGGRVDTAYCVTCHNPGSTDANSGNIVDFKVMIHKIHRGANLPSVVAGGDYSIWGFQDTEHDYSQTILPMDIRNCTACHDDTIAETPDAANWENKPTKEACGSCHDDVNFVTGDNHPAGAQPDNSECAVCHKEGGLASIRGRHLGVMVNIDVARESFTAEPQAIRIDQGTGDVEVDVMLELEGTPVVALRDAGDVDTDVGAVLGKYKYGTDNGSLAINWFKADGYQIAHQEVDFNDCVADGGGLFTCSVPGLLPGISDADWVTTVPVDLFTCMNEIDGLLARCDSVESSIMRITQAPVTPSFVFFNGDGTSSTESYELFGADMASCRNCHKDKIFHHGATELGQCKTCHNATRAASRGRPADLKHHVHRFHSGLDDDPITPVEAGDVDHFPNKIQNCAACHADGQIDLPLQQNHRASAANRDAPVYISPTAVVCSACHLDVALGYIDPVLPGLIDPANGTISANDQAVIDHMIQNGAVFGSADFNIANKVESCAVCHAVGSEFGVDEVHK
jgi:OmcA/MtrC family decaheme c-type cytochrome